MSEIIHKVTPDQNDVLYHALNAYIHLLIQQDKRETKAIELAVELRDMTEQKEDGEIVCPVNWADITTPQQARQDLINCLVIKLFQN